MSYILNNPLIRQQMPDVLEGFHVTIYSNPVFPGRFYLLGMTVCGNCVCMTCPVYLLAATIRLHNISKPQTTNPLQLNAQCNAVHIHYSAMHFCAWVCIALYVYCTKLHLQGSALNFIAPVFALHFTHNYPWPDGNSRSLA